MKFGVFMTLAFHENNMMVVVSIDTAANWFGAVSLRI